MTARQAKKVLRRAILGAGARGDRFIQAQWVIARLHQRNALAGHGFTPGWRWGRWDPKPGINPKEVPF